jgi:hypothetical protein
VTTGTGPTRAARPARRRRLHRAAPRRRPGLGPTGYRASAGMPEGSTPRHTTLDCRALRARFDIAAREPWPTIDRVLAFP